MKIAPSTLYERDFNLWIGAQLEALRAGRVQDLDLKNVIEELESLARRNRTAVKSQLKRLYLHLLKMRYQPQKRTPSWTKSVDGAMTAIFEALSEIPSLRPELRFMALEVYALARRSAAKGTRLPRDQFPVNLPHEYEMLAVALAKVNDVDALDALIDETLGP